MAQEDKEHATRYYCRKCRTWSYEPKCSSCGEPTVLFIPDTGTLAVIAGAWDPEDGLVHITNADDMRNLAADVVALNGKVEQVLELLKKEELQRSAHTHT